MIWIYHNKVDIVHKIVVKRIPVQISMKQEKEKMSLHVFRGNAGTCEFRAHVLLEHTRVFMCEPAFTLYSDIKWFCLRHLYTVDEQLTSDEFK